MSRVLGKKNIRRTVNNLFMQKKVNNLYVLATKVFISAVKCRAVALLENVLAAGKCLFGLVFWHPQN